MSAETQRYVDTLILEFRELVLSIQEEQRDLLQKLREFPEPLTLESNTRTFHTIENNTVKSSSNSNSNSNTNSGSISPPSDGPNHSNSTALSSSIATTNGSARPPSYKTATIKPDDKPQQVPKPPLRQKKRLTSASSTLPNNFSLTNEAAAAALARLNRVQKSRYNTMTSPTTVASRGALIVLEGLDRVGKSTLAKKLIEHLQRINKPVASCRFPDRSTKVGQLIDDLLKNSSKQVDDHVMHLLFSANRWELNRTIRNTILKGTTVIVDRYAYSGMAYSSAKGTLTMDWCRHTERGLPKPDLVIYLELPKESQYARSGFGEERFETREFQELIRKQYETVISSSKENWITIDVADKSPDEVLGEIIIPVRSCLESCANKEFGDLEFT